MAAKENIVANAARTSGTMIIDTHTDASPKGRRMAARVIDFDASPDSRTRDLIRVSELRMLDFGTYT